MAFEIIIVCTIGLVIAWQFVLYTYILEAKEEYKITTEILHKVRESFRKFSIEFVKLREEVEKENKSSAEGSAGAESKE